MGFVLGKLRISTVSYRLHYGINRCCLDSTMPLVNLSTRQPCTTAQFVFSQSTLESLARVCGVRLSRFRHQPRSAADAPIRAKSARHRLSGLAKRNSRSAGIW